LHVAEVLTWVIQRRMVSEDRAGRLREELVEIETEMLRLEAAETVIAQFTEADRAGEADDPEMDAEFKHVIRTSGAGGLLLMVHREDGMDAGVLPEDHQETVRLVAGVPEVVKAADVSGKIGKGTLPAQVKAVRAKLKRLAERGCLHRTPAGHSCVPAPGAAGAGS
jgi:hypothetical protein